MDTMQEVWLVTVTELTSAKPTGYGIFDNAYAMSKSLHDLDLKQGTETGLRNPDGSIAAFIFTNERYCASIAMMPADIACAVANLDTPTWDVPDQMEG